MRTKFGRVMVLAALVLAALALAALPVLAAPGGEPAGQVPSLLEMLGLLAQGVGTGFVLAFLFERSGRFAGLASETKWRIVFATSLALPVVAQLLLDVVPVTIVAVLDPYWRALAAGFLGWAGSQVAFKTLVKPARKYTLLE